MKIGCLSEFLRHCFLFLPKSVRSEMIFTALNLLDRVGGTRFSLYDYGRGASPVVVDKLHPH